MKHPWSQWRPLSIAVLYFLLSAAWIIASDSLLEHLQLDHRKGTTVAILKGLLYLAVTSTFIWIILRKLHTTQAQLQRDVSTRTTALMMSEADLRRSEERMRRLLSNLPDVTRTSNASGKITYISANVKDLLGFNAEEVCAYLPEFWLDRIHEEDRDRVVAAYRRLFKEGVSVDLEFRLRHRDGRWVWLHDRASRTKNGTYHADGIFSDITKRKEIEEQALRYEANLKAQEEQLRNSLTELGMALEAARAGTYDLDLDTRTVSWSDELRLVYGMQPGEFLGTLDDWLSCVLPEDVDTVFPELKKGSEVGDGHWEFRIRRRDDGDIRWIEGRGQVIYEGDRPKRMIGIHTDITDRKRAENEMDALKDQFRHAQKMEAVGRLAGGIAHDFNNLLMVIRGYSEIMNERLAGADPLKRHAQEVMKAADRAAGLTGQLLAFSRKQVLSPIVFDLHSLVQDTTKMLKRLIGEDVELKVSAADDLWRVRADQDQIVQVLMNLCVNARDAMPRGGRLSIGIANTRTTEDDKELLPYIAVGEYVSLTVEDTGTGMSPEVREHIFEPFFTTKEQGKGTGLGLSTVYGIIKQSGGFVWVDSTEGKGTRFTIYLPAALEGVPESHVSHQQAEIRGSETILVVEDEDGLRDAIRDYLTGLGYNVLYGSSAEEAMKVVASSAEDIKLLLTDVVMPKHSGRELLEWLRRERPSLPGIFMSGYIDDSVIRHGIEESHHFLQKPFSLGAMAAKIREVLAETVGN